MLHAASLRPLMLPMGCIVCATCTACAVIGYDVVEPSGYYKMVQRGRAGCALPRLSARGVQAPIKPPHILAGYTFLFENMLGEALFVPRNVEKREEIIKGVDGNDIKLFISTGSDR